MLELNQKLYELIINVATHAPQCNMMIALLRRKPSLDEHCTCWKKEAIKIIEQIDRELENAQTNI